MKTGIRLKKRKGLVKDDWSSGFSFVETLAVLAITAVLSSSIGVAANKMLQKARKISAKNQIEQLGIALQSYYADCGRFPTEEQGLSALWKKPEFYPVSENWDGPYLEKKLTRDPWGNEYVYHGSGWTGYKAEEVPDGLPYSIVSYGADGVEGGDGDEKDICSWE